MPNWERNENGILRCTQCGNFVRGIATNGGELVPAGSADGGRCHGCGSDTFEQVSLVPAD